MKIIADIICKNEILYIEYCVKSILPYIDMVFITDTGSHDGTIGKIRQLQSQHPEKIKVFTYKWNNNYSDAHNFVLNEIQHYDDFDYYLRVDADEIYLHSQLSTLKDQLNNNPNQIAWQMPYINFHGGHKCFDKYDTKPNICKLKGHDVKYIGNVHEFVYIDNKHIGTYADKYLDGHFFHHYSWCIINRRYMKKLERVKSERKINKYNDTRTQSEAITKFYSQFKTCPDWQLKGNYKGQYPEVMKDSKLLENKKYSVDNNLDSPCICLDKDCEYKCIIDTWETSCSNYNFRKENCK